MSMKDLVKKCISGKLKNIIIFESSPDFSDNTYWFFKYLVEEEKIHTKYKLVWFVKSDSNKITSLCGADIKCVNPHSSNKMEQLKTRYYHAKARFIIDCNEYISKFVKSQKRVHLTHGMPVKTVGAYSSSNPEFDVLPITSSYYRPYFESFYPHDSIKVLGSPRNDVLLQANKSPSPFGQTVFLWMPTYRQHQNQVSDMQIENLFPLGLPVLKSHNDIIELNEHLKMSNALLLFRPHPAQDLSMLSIESCSNIIIANDGYLASLNLQLYELLSCADALITDYSSVYNDYLLLDRPIALTLEDFDSFSKKWPLFLSNPETELVGTRINDLDGMIKFIDDTITGRDALFEKRMYAKRQLNQVLTPTASEQLYNYLASNFGM